MVRHDEVYQVENLTVDSPPREIERAWAWTLEEIAGLADLAADHQIPVILLIHPFRFQTERPQQTRQPQEKLIEFGRSRGWTSID